MVGLKLLFIAITLMFSISQLYGEVTGESLTVDDIKKLTGLTVYVQGGYTHNLKNPNSQENELRIFDHKANSFILDLAQLIFTKEQTDGKPGFKLKLSAGETARWIHSRGLGTSDDAFDLTEAYLSYIMPLGKGLRFDFGKFVTYHGAEVIEAKDNPNYSRSFLFNYAIPFTHTGLKISYPFSDILSSSLYIVNGWDNTDDNNKGKTLGLSIGYTTIEELALTFNFIYGPEQDNNTSNYRFLFDWIGTIKPAKNLTFILNTDYGTEEKAAPDGTDAKWYGIAAIAKYDFNNLYILSVRTEYFKDDDGSRTGRSQALMEITLTLEFRIANSLIIRPEYRHDRSDREVFDNGRKKSQDTLAFGVMYTW